jgi:hypothetical protein
MKTARSSVKAFNLIRQGKRAHVFGYADADTFVTHQHVAYAQDEHFKSLLF